MTIPDRTEKFSHRKASNLARLMTFTFAIIAVAILALCIGVLSADDSSADPTIELVIEAGDGTDGTGSVELEGSTITVLTPPTKTGYYVEGYYTDAECTTSNKIAGSNGKLLKLNVQDWTDGGKWIKESDEPVTIYVKWNIEWYTIWFKKSNYVIHDSFTRAYGADITADVENIETPTNDGFIFTGWDPEVPDTMPLNGLTTYATWAPITYTIAFDGNGADSGSMDSIDMTFGEGAFLPDCAFVKTGHIFNGWMDVNGEVVYADGQYAANDTYEQGAIVTLRVKWSPITYHIEFHKNDHGQDEFKHQYVSYGEHTRLSKNTFTRTGYTFVGWNTMSDLTGDTYEDEQEIYNLFDTNARSLILWAEWAPIEYNIAFNSNGGTGSMANINGVAYDTDQPITNTFQRAGYTFSGEWAVGSASGEHVTSPVRNLTPTAGATVTLYALWTPNQYTITLISGEGEANNGTATVTFGMNDFKITKVPVKDRYEVNGYWATDSGGTVANAAGTLSNYAGWVADGKWCNSAQNQSLYVNWIGKEYDVQFRSNGGDTGDFTTKIRYLEDYGNISVQIPTRTGYTFAGYYEAIGGNKQVFDPQGQAVADVSGWTEDGKWSSYSNQQVLYAHWTPKLYNITVYNGDEATGCTLEIHFDATRISNTTGTLDVEGYNVVGLYAEKGCQTKVLNGDCTTVKGVEGWTDADGKWRVAQNTELYVKYEPKTTALTLDKNGGAQDGSATVTYDSKTMTSFVTVTRTGYTLTGYYTANTGGTKIIDAKGSLCANTAYTDSEGKWINAAASLTLYAQWTANTYKITVDPNGGTGSFQFNVTYGTSNDIPNMTSHFSKPGYYIFFDITLGPEAGGGFIIEHGTEQGVEYYRFNGNVPGYTTIEDGMVKWVHDGDVTVYLSWAPNSYSGILSSNGLGTDGSFTVTYGCQTVGVTHAARVGYDTAGYFTEPNGAGTFVITGDTPETYYLERNVPGLTDGNGCWIYTGDETVTLYSTWTLHFYPIFIDKNGGDENGWYRSTYDSDHMDVLAQVSRAGYHLAGIYTDTECTDENQLADADGHFLNKTIDGIIENGKWKCIDDDKTFYAKWVANTYKVTVNANGGTGTFEFDVTYGQINSIPDFTDRFSMVGHSISWSITLGTQAGSVGIISHEIVVATGENQYRFVRCEGYTDNDVKWVHDGDVTVYLSWDPITYSGELIAGDGGSNGHYEVTYGFNTVNVFHAGKTGYNVGGYYTEPNGAGVYALTGSFGETYHFAQNIPNVTDSEGKWISTVAVPLYATWNPVVTQIHIDKNGGDSDGYCEATFDTNHLVIDHLPSKTGYHVAGIYADAECTEANKISGSDGILLNATVAGFIENGIWKNAKPVVTIYAKWEISQFTITFDSNGGSDVAPITQNYDTNVNAPANPTRDGYTFSSWSPVLPAKMPAKNTTVKAVWAVIPQITDGATIVYTDSEADTVVIEKAAIEDPLADEAKTEINVNGDGWKMEIPKEIISGATGVVSVGAKNLSNEDIDALPAEVKTIVEGKTVFSLSITDNNGAVSFNGKSITVSLPYVLKDGEDASDVKVFFINANNQAEQVDAIYDSESNCAVFTTTHFSTWYVDVIPDDPSPDGGMNIGMIIGIAVAVIAVVGVVAFVLLRKGKAA